jgi:hypothetical protein
LRRYTKELTQMQRDTDEYDRRAMRVLSIALYPIVVAYGVYSLMVGQCRLNL